MAKPSLSPIKSKRRWAGIAVFAVALALLAAGGVVIYSYDPGLQSIQHTQLPQEGLQQKLVKNRESLYASNENISDMLFRLDIFFKNQGLQGDANSPDFKPETDAAGNETVSNCVQFKYSNIQDNRVAAIFTLIPDEPKCFSANPDVINKVKELQSRYRYVYAVEVL